MLGLKIFLRVAATRHFLLTFVMRLRRDCKTILTDGRHDCERSDETPLSQTRNPKSKGFIIKILKIVKELTKFMKKALKFRLSHIISWLLGVAMSVTSFFLTKGQLTIPPPAPPKDIVSDTIVSDSDKSIILLSPASRGGYVDHVVNETIATTNSIDAKSGGR